MANYGVIAKFRLFMPLLCKFVFLCLQIYVFFFVLGAQTVYPCIRIAVVSYSYVTYVKYYIFRCFQRDLTKSFRKRLKPETGSFKGVPYNSVPYSLHMYEELF